MRCRPQAQSRSVSPTKRRNEALFDRERAHHHKSFFDDQVEYCEKDDLACKKKVRPAYFLMLSVACSLPTGVFLACDVGRTKQWLAHLSFK